MINRSVSLITALLFGLLAKGAEKAGSARDAIVLDSQLARLSVDLAGGAIGEFRVKDRDVNPLSWNVPRPGDTSPQGFGHFLCLDRWGPPSDAEGRRGMPYHGEASHVMWNIEEEATKNGDGIEAVLKARLPMAGLSVRRTVRLSAENVVFSVREEVTNENPLGRVFNMVQHATIAPPFLDETTIVDCNGRKGFAQGGNLPTPEEPSSEWPRVLKKDGASVDLRHLTNDPNPNVVSFAIDDDYGWVTAATPAKGLLIGYLWKASDYPWVSLWRDVHDGKPAARGLEFGTTGLHQPFPILLKKGGIWDRPLFEYLDGGETRIKGYIGFLVPVPADFRGVKSLKREGEVIKLVEHPTARSEREFVVSLRGISF
ncbi:MAG TPA: hypothetical protein VGR78_02450 [Verrucomicrobiae bacterium]|nr:hypothetical protein [Verrucomicrobiae bacterium]